jgi:hypothetical protein
LVAPLPTFATLIISLAIGPGLILRAMFGIA